MRRSTAAAIGTFTGAALIMGVRLSVSPPVVSTAVPAADPAATSKSAPQSKKPAGRQKSTGGTAGADESRLKDGTYRGRADYAYGTIELTITVDGGKITATDATYPVTGNSAVVNPPAIKQLRQETLGARSAKDVDAVSGATLTSTAYQKSLQAALDAAGA